MVDEHILEESKKTKILASALLHEKKILEILSQIGTPQIIWSYALDLMVDPDIDIVVQTDFPEQSAKKALNEFIEKKTVQKYEFGDFVHFPRIGRPQWYIVNLRTGYKGIKWEIEIWFLGNTDMHKEQLHMYQSRITEENRLQILQEKHKRNALGQTKHTRNSVEIYNEILHIQ